MNICIIYCTFSSFMDTGVLTCLRYIDLAQVFCYTVKEIFPLLICVLAVGAPRSMFNFGCTVVIFITIIAISTVPLVRLLTATLAQ